MTTIIFCIPGNKFSNIFLKCWTELVFYCVKNNINPILSNDYDSNVYFVRSKILGANTLSGKYQKPFNGEIKYDYIMFIDSDIIFNVEDFDKLIKMNNDISCGAYLMDGGKNYAIVENMTNEDFEKNGCFNFISKNDLSKYQEPFKVDYCGMGFMLIKKNIIEQIEYPWFYPKIFNFKNNICEFTSEDVGFCLKLKEKKINIYINPEIKVGHEKTCIYI
tara:strand:+ start:253 stop:909 length:657 start_codon:yes stop_codon:yes gene_type:complete